MGFPRFRFAASGVGGGVLGSLAGVQAATELRFGLQISKQWGIDFQPVLIGGWASGSECLGSGPDCLGYKRFQGEVWGAGIGLLGSWTFAERFSLSFGPELIVSDTVVGVSSLPGEFPGAFYIEPLWEPFFWTTDLSVHFGSIDAHRRRHALRLGLDTRWGASTFGLVFMPGISLGYVTH